MSSITATPVTSVPACPSWCTKPDGHEYDMEDAVARNESRFHRYEYDELLFGECTMFVSIAAWELRSTITGRRIIHPAAVCLELDSIAPLANLSADEAQTLADQLHTAAVMVDRIGGMA